MDRPTIDTQLHGVIQFSSIPVSLLSEPTIVSLVHSIHPACTACVTITLAVALQVESIPSHRLSISRSSTTASYHPSAPTRSFITHPLCKAVHKEEYIRDTQGAVYHSTPLHSTPLLCSLFLEGVPHHSDQLARLSLSQAALSETSHTSIHPSVTRPTNQQFRAQIELNKTVLLEHTFHITLPIPPLVWGLNPARGLALAYRQNTTQRACR